ncbi:MAG: DUF5615 family PIN-like protein [Dysgonamonadaceae bacterium]|jgi:predicted nuclease of predicted toxin-antitoxin system|nr:DUF5615 family PIN-like protein [Dysgonamonadaceae bacterium]
MKVQLLLDANLSWRSVSILKNHFDNCIHVDNIGLPVPAKDIEIWEYAKSQNLMIVTNDDDFFNIFSIKGFPPKIIMLRMGNQSRKFTEQTLVNMKQAIYDLAVSTSLGVLEVL